MGSVDTIGDLISTVLQKACVTDNGICRIMSQKLGALGLVPRSPFFVPRPSNLL